MREYATPAAFRAAVEARLRERARSVSAPAYMIRRQAALERLLARLSKVAPDRWAVKGELALAGQPFAPLQVDVTIAPPDPWDAEPLWRPGLLAAVGLEPFEVLLIPLERQRASPPTPPVSTALTPCRRSSAPAARASSGSGGAAVRLQSVLHL